MTVAPFISTIACLLVAASSAQTPVSVRVLDAGMHRLGVDGAPEWTDSPKTEAQQLEVTFEATVNDRPYSLLLRQSGVKFAWPVLLNGKKIGALSTSHQALVHTLVIPPGGLSEGLNRLSIPPMPGGDDIEVGDVQLLGAAPQEAFAEAGVEVTVTEAETGAGMPCRITIADEQGALAALQPLPGQSLAARAGVVYTGDGKARIGLRPGKYTVYATRGFEYGVDSAQVLVRKGDLGRVSMEIRREVPTPGLAASDTHIHTLTFSKHGDATIEERMLTIAGEGIELPIATDHNAHADYRPPAAASGVDPFFTPVIGNEVTSKVGHFNAFPIKPGSAVADFRLENWQQLVRIVRATPGVKVVTLNHPRDEHSKFTPLGQENFNATTGEVLFSPEFSFDAMEVITSAAMQSDIMRLYHDWFALLNHGHRVTAIASSDTHDVSRFVLGQARSYVMCEDGDPARIDVEAACESFLEGRVLVSMGLLTQMSVDGRFVSGDLASELGETVNVTVTVDGPTWTQADRVELFANGIKIREEAVTPGAAIRKATVNWVLPRPAHDVHLVAVATGPGVRAPYCDTPRPYQPQSRVFTPRVIGSTNPIWVDGDGDGEFTPARDYAKRLDAEAGGDAERLLSSLATHDEAVAIQAAALCVARGVDFSAAAVQRRLSQAAPQVRRGFDRVLERR